MSSPDHCRHCAESCVGSGDPDWTDRWHVNDDETAMWRSQSCQGCAEAGLVAAYMRDAAARKRATLYAAADVVEFGIRNRPVTARGES